jgi:hypothetical protein
MAVSNQVKVYARMWPREVFDYRTLNGNRKQALAMSLEFLNKPGVYVLYRDDVPYYIGKAAKLRHRIQDHATKVGGRYYNHWNFFSAFVIENSRNRNEIEGILIAAMPTANSANPKLQREKLPDAVKDMVRMIRRHCANPLTEDKMYDIVQEASN